MSFEDKVMNYLAEIHQKITVMDNRLINIENDHGAKLSALFDGYEQNTQAIEQLKQGQEHLKHGQNQLSLKVEQNTQAIEQLKQGQEHLKHGQNQLSLKVEQNTQAIKSLENRVATQEIKLQVIKN